MECKNCCIASMEKFYIISGLEHIIERKNAAVKTLEAEGRNSELSADDRRISEGASKMLAEDNISSFRRINYIIKQIEQLPECEESGW